MTKIGGGMLHVIGLNIVYRPMDIEYQGCRFAAGRSSIVDEQTKVAMNGAPV